ncbi:hypothetical protein TC_0358 [Chlamydia muridarum str. Nigg]|uniref:Uncharacterized protein n=1 Tax=Chlamydia muridarum (strain MoPn / Nigg) TaxID=243161 RepID=Q9PKV3_CHLMU|nr:hypothetical protein TC_0358 [Chlamydia muridarum str. Nigg]
MRKLKNTFLRVGINTSLKKKNLFLLSFCFVFNKKKINTNKNHFSDNYL